MLQGRRVYGRKTPSEDPLPAIACILQRSPNGGKGRQLYRLQGAFQIVAVDKKQRRCFFYIKEQ